MLKIMFARKCCAILGKYCLKRRSSFALSLAVPPLDKGKEKFKKWATIFLKYIPGEIHVWKKKPVLNLAFNFEKIL